MTREDVPKGFPPVESVSWSRLRRENVHRLVESQLHRGQRLLHVADERRSGGHLVPLTVRPSVCAVATLRAERAQRLPEVVPAQTIQEEVHGEIAVVHQSRHFLRDEQFARRPVGGVDEADDEEVDADGVTREVEQDEGRRHGQQHLRDLRLRPAVGRAPHPAFRRRFRQQDAGGRHGGCHGGGGRQGRQLTARLLQGQGCQ